MNDLSLLLIQKMGKYYEELIKPIAKEFDVTSIEIKILSFLDNHPDNDCAKDIVEKRLLPKGNVSTFIDKLVERGFLKKVDDPIDHRLTHLKLKPECVNILEQIRQVNCLFEQSLYKNMDESEKYQVNNLVRLLIHNIDESRKELKNGNKR